MPGKNKPNGFLLYANEVKNQLLKGGHVIRNTPELIQAAAPDWQALPADEREYYKEKAKWEWDNRHVTGKYFSRSGNTRVDNTGTVVKAHVDLVCVMETRREKERQEVFMSFPADKGVLEQKFYFVSFQCLLEDPSYQPIEVAATEFSLLNGRERHWHKHINPGPIPQGYRYKAQQNSELSHKLPVEGKMDPRDNYTKIYDELFNFLSRGTRHIPPIHVKMSDCERVEECLKWLAENAGRPNLLKRVYELEGLMLDLDSHLRGEPQNLMQMKQNATDILSTSVFDWDKGSRCEYHEDEDNETDTKFCSLGYVNRYCFCLADYFCTHHGIQVTDNHLPPKQNEVCYTLVQSKDVLAANNRKSNRGNRHNSSSSSSTVYGNEDLARQVTEKLRLEQESRSRYYQQQEDEEKLATQREEEQKKRWMALRGSPNKSSSEISTNSSDIAAINSPQFVMGRGRGRGVNGISNLRRPGDKINSTQSDGLLKSEEVADNNRTVRPPPGFTVGPGRGMGRGTKLHANISPGEKKESGQPLWAGTSAAPAAADAPRPPRAWMT